MPLELEHVWGFFIDLFNPEAHMGYAKIEYREIEAYARMTNRMITPDEVFLIRDLSAVWGDVKRKKASKPTGVPEGTKNLTSMKDQKGLRALFMRQGTKGPAARAPRSRKAQSS